MIVPPDDVLTYWFATPARDADELKAKIKRWYMGGAEIDAEIRARFSDTVHAAIAGALGDSWRSHPKGWLAEIVVLDQFTRNVLRDSPRMFDGDARARALAIEGLDSGRTRALPLEERNFAIMPLAHSEELAHQRRSAEEIARLHDDAPPALKPIFAMGIEQTRKYLGIVERFGRLPHRNAILGRASTPEELEFLREWEAKRAPAGMRTT